uniref:PIN domain-containing protein n=1 Tax=Anopheles atroparvus TaxID=41427 RepID=A0AAG5DBJ3_ANOAO
MEYSSNDVKQLFRSVYTLVKGQDERKATLTADDILDPSFLVSHRVLVAQCVQLMFEDFENVGKKSREILWRKGYYDVIYVLKRQKGRAGGAVLQQASDHLIREGINYFKAIVLRFAELFHLDAMRFLVDYRLLEDYDEEALRRESSCYSLLQLRANDASGKNELYTKQEISYALETIHSLLISLGDLHRYQLEFGIGNRVEVLERTRNFYLEAFKLNPKIGMAQNQLGMLVAGQNCNLDSVYHYLYSLCCTIPFECSDTNVNHIFQKNIRHLENGGGFSEERLGEGDDRAVEDFIATFLLVVDVFFYDKDVTDFTALCHSVLIDFKKVLGMRQLLDEYYMTEDMIFKIVSILFFCMHRIRLSNSDKIYSLNAFLVALCSELLEYCTMGIEKWMVEHVREDNRFREQYTRQYQQYDEQVHRARAMLKSHGSGMFSKDQKSSSGVEEGTASQDSHGMANKENESRADSKGKSLEKGDRGAKKAYGARVADARSKKHSRRRRRAFSNGSESEEDEEDDDDERFDDDSDNDYSDGSEHDSDSEAEEDAEEDDDDADIMSLSSFGSYDEYSGEEEDEERIEQRRAGSGKQSPVDQRSDGEKHPGKGEERRESSPIPEEQLKFKKRYNKPNPNIVLEFAHDERTLRSLKLLFDWLLSDNLDVLHNCYQSNPEFLHNIMKLLNYFNVDVLTNRFYFTRDMVTVAGLREDLQTIFNIRRTIPLREDVAMKRFPLFELTQEGLAWDTPYKLAIGREDESFLRLMKLVDFGFVVCKSKKFDYSFLTKTREFSFRSGGGPGSGRGKQKGGGGQKGSLQQRGGGGGKKRSKQKGDGTKRDWNVGGDGANRNRTGMAYSQTSRSGRTAAGQGGGKRDNRAGRGGDGPQLQRLHDDDGDAFGLPREDKRQRNQRQRKRETFAEVAVESNDGPTLFTKKGYLRNRANGGILQRSSGKEESNGAVGLMKNSDEQAVPTQRETKQAKEKDLSAVMGRLWLENEVETLETKLKRRAVNVILTPYLVLDSKCLTEYTSIVKNLVKTKKFVVLIPSAVLGDLDELKKHSEGARNAIKWLEIEFSKGNRFLRTQKNHESLPMPLVKIPKKLDRDGSTFNSIVQFCNHIVTNHADKDCSDIITYLSGDSVQDKKLGNGSSYTGILEAIPVKFEQIVTFYSSYKRK